MALQLDREGIKGREDGERRRGGDYLREASILKYFCQRGVIIQGRRLFEKWLLFKELRYLSSTVSSVRKGSTFK